MRVAVRSRMWAAAVTDVGRARLRKRDRVSPWGWLQKVTGSRGKDATQLNQKVLGVCVLRRFKSLCDLEIEASRIAGTDLWASEALRENPNPKGYQLHEQG